VNLRSDWNKCIWHIAAMQHSTMAIVEKVDNLVTGGGLPCICTCISWFVCPSLFLICFLIWVFVLLQLFFTKISISIITLLLQHLTISIQLGKDSKGFELYSTNQCLEV
jgi:hypothetical protein